MMYLYIIAFLLGATIFYMVHKKLYLHKKAKYIPYSLLVLMFLNVFLFPYETIFVTTGMAILGSCIGWIIYYFIKPFDR